MDAQTVVLGFGTGAIGGLLAGILNAWANRSNLRDTLTHQREMENAVAAAIQKKALSGHEVLQVRATLTIPGVLPELVIDGEIALDGLPPPAA